MVEIEFVLDREVINSDPRLLILQRRAPTAEKQRGKQRLKFKPKTPLAKKPLVKNPVVKTCGEEACGEEACGEEAYSHGGRLVH